MGWKVGLGVTGALALCAGAVHAQEEGVVLPPISVSATQVPTPQSEVASSVTVITAQEIEKSQRRTVPDLLQAQPGLNVVQTGGPGGQTAVFIRGTNANHVKVLLDGIDISDPTSPNGAVDFGHLLTSNLERVEILRGPQSGLYGANAIGGVIYLTTKKGEGPPKMGVTLEGGSFGTFNQAANLSGSLERFNYNVDVTHFRAASTPVTPDHVLPPGQQRNNDFYDNLTFSSRFGADLTEDFSVNVYSRMTQSKLLFTNDSFNLATFLFEPNTQRTDQRADQVYARGEAVWSMFDGRLVNTFGVNHTYSTRDSTDPGATTQTFTGWRDKYDWRGNIAIAPGQTLVLGLEHEEDRIDTPTAQASRGSDAGFAELQLQWAKRFFVVGNVRYDHDDVFGGHPTWRVGPAVIIPGTETKLKATYGTGFKAPTLLELYGDDPINFFVANRALKPEESTGWDVGFEQPLFNNRASFGATYYQNEVTNLIQFVVLGPALFSNANIGKANINGYEAFAALTLDEHWKFRADYTQTNAEDAITKLELVRRPQHKVTASAIWQPSQPWTFTATYVYVSDWIDFDRASSARIVAPGYSVVNLAANYRVNANAELFGRIDNLFNEQYENPYGWLRPGIGVFAGLRVSN